MDLWPSRVLTSGLSDHLIGLRVAYIVVMASIFFGNVFSSFLADATQETSSRLAFVALLVRRAKQTAAGRFSINLMLCIVNATSMFGNRGLASDTDDDDDDDDDDQVISDAALLNIAMIGGLTCALLLLLYLLLKVRYAL